MPRNPTGWDDLRVLATVPANPATTDVRFSYRAGQLRALDSTGAEAIIGPAAQLAVAATNTTVNGSYPDSSSYWRRVTTTDAFPFTGMLTGVRLGTAHTQRLQEETTGNTYARVWNNAGSAWTAWLQYLDVGDLLAKGDLIAATAAGAYAVRAVGADGTRLTADSTQATGLAYVPSTDGIAAFSRAGAAAVVTGVMRYPVPFAGVITRIQAMVNTAPTGAAIIVDVKKNGTSLYTTTANRPTIAISGNASTTTQPDVTAVTAGDYLTVDILQVGSTVAGSDLTAAVALRRTA